MTEDWTPDEDTARTFARYRKALLTERELKPDVRDLAVDAMRDGATIAQVAELTGMTPEVFRRLARDNEIPVAAKYQSRAELLRARKAALPPSATPDTDQRSSS